MDVAMESKIEITCIMKSAISSQSIFPVVSHPHKMVEDLREAIKAAKQAALAKVDASDLRVWKVRND
jgi:hypothetical protein